MTMKWKVVAGVLEYWTNTDMGMLGNRNSPTAGVDWAGWTDFLHPPLIHEM